MFTKSKRLTKEFTNHCISLSKIVRKNCVWSNVEVGGFNGGREVIGRGEGSCGLNEFNPTLSPPLSLFYLGLVRQEICISFSGGGHVTIKKPLVGCSVVCAAYTRR